MNCPKCGYFNPAGKLRCEKCEAILPEETLLPTPPIDPRWSVAAEVPAEQAEAASRPVLHPGFLLGDRYEILQLLGEGGMGAVYRARDRELERVIALKVIRPELIGHAEILRRFKQEIILARKITHKNVIRIFDLGQADGMKFITMEYVEGRDLKALLRTELRFSVERTVGIIKQVCLALDAAHSEAVVHRDLKPSNIMLDSHDKVTVMDFGIAHSMEMTGMTRTGSVLGTPEYMSPEQAMSGKIDTRSDLFAVGLIFYEMLTGRNPFEADTVLGTLVKRTQERATPPVELDHSIPPALNAVVVKCLAKDPEQRYQSAREVLEDLESGHAPPQPEAAPAARELRRGAVPWKWLAAGAAVVLLAAVGYMLRDRFLFRTPAQQKPVTVLVADFSNATSDPVFDGSLEPVVNVAMEGASFVTTYDRGQARKIAGQLKQGATTLDVALARLVAAREGINVIVDGSIALRNGEYKVSAQAIDALTGKQIVTASAQASRKEDVLGSMGRLSARIRKTLGDTTPESAQLAAAETFTSSSLEAAQAYAVAQKLQGAGDWEEAIAGYNRAIQLDPGLGRAYAGLAVMYRNLGRRDEAEKQYQLAMKNIDRMTDRERYKTRGGYFLVVGNYPKAIEELTQLIENYPADFAGHTNLALAYFFTRKMEPALQEARRATEIYPNNVVMRTNLALFAMYAGDFKTAEDESRELLKRDTSYGSIYVCLALSQLAQGRSDEAAETYRRLERLDAAGASAASTGLADLAIFEGRPSAAVDILKRGIAADRATDNAPAAARKSMLLAFAYLALGQNDRALAEASRVAGESTQAPLLFEAARAFVAAGRAERALEISSSLGSSLRQESRMYAKLIEGEVRLSRRETWEAIRLFHEAQELTDTWLARFGQGRAYLEASAFTEAYSEFEQCLKRRGETAAIFLDDVPSLWYLPPAYYYLGRAQQGLGSPAAAESYRTFLSIRGKSEKDPLVTDAQRRLATF